MERILVCSVLWIFVCVVIHVHVCNGDVPVAESKDGGGFLHSAVLKSGIFYLFWKYDDNRITFEVQVRTAGYVGVGFSPKGGMAGADIVLAWVKDGQVYVKDCFATHNGQPAIDKTQDVKLVSGSENGTFTTIRFSRELNTCDKNDRDITEGTVRLIWAYGDADPETETSMNYHGVKQRGTKSIQLLAARAAAVRTVPSDAYNIDMLNLNVTIRSSERTLYWCHGIKLPSFQGVHHVIKYEAIIPEKHKWLVHHIFLYACYHKVDVDKHDGAAWQCYSPITPPELRDCFKVVFAWDKGGEAFYFPEHVGFPLGDDQGPTFLIMETHYNNPSGEEINQETSGLRLTLIPRRRQYDAGLIEAGVTPVNMPLIIPHGQPGYKIWGYCPASCIARGMGEVKEIRAFAITLHSHLLATKMHIRQFRDGIELPFLATDETYDFDFQEIRHLKKEVVIKKGDSLVTMCTYNSTRRDNPTWGGFSTTSEMCLGYVFYYPRIDLSNCETSVKMDKYFDTVAEKLNITGDKDNPLYRVLFRMYVKQFLDLPGGAKTLQEMEYTSPRVQKCQGPTFFVNDVVPPLNIASPYTPPAGRCTGPKVLNHNDQINAFNETGPSHEWTSPSGDNTFATNTNLGKIEDNQTSVSDPGQQKNTSSWHTSGPLRHDIGFNVVLIILIILAIFGLFYRYKDNFKSFVSTQWQKYRRVSYSLVMNTDTVA